MTEIPKSYLKKNNHGRITYGRQCRKKNIFKQNIESLKMNFKKTRISLLEKHED